ncbi:MAG: VanZ family protein [Verrucomicrobiota bacterium]|nr:VanZ family protein [Verrucomicrobiota bacterium]
MKSAVLSIIASILAVLAVTASCVSDDLLSVFFPLLKVSGLHFDLFLHAGIYTALTLCLLNLINPAISILLTFLFSTSLEIMQGFFIDGREFSFLDLVANSLGIIIALIIYQLYKSSRKL